MALTPSIIAVSVRSRSDQDEIDQPDQTGGNAGGNQGVIDVKIVCGAKDGLVRFLVHAQGLGQVKADGL